MKRIKRPGILDLRGFPEQSKRHTESGTLSEEDLEFVLRSRGLPIVYEEIQEPFSRYSKKQIPDNIRWQVWERDNFTCLKCKSRRYLSVDHIIPEIEGGKATLENLQTLCKFCNSSKKTKTINYRV